MSAKASASKPSKAKASMVGKSLVVVESPAKAKTIEKYLKGDYKVLASVGHILDLPKSKLGVDIEKDFEPEGSLRAWSQHQTLRTETIVSSALRFWPSKLPEK